VYQETNIDVADLSIYYQQRLEQSISADNLQEAMRLVRQLQDAVVTDE
jgi:hypothetical protein